ncbi:MAG: hypothetical protein AB8D52_07390 [Gammaproteobacteria bacterium]
MFGSTEFNSGSVNNPFSANTSGASRALTSLFDLEPRTKSSNAVEKNNPVQSNQSLGLKNDSDVANFLAARLASPSNSNSPYSAYDSSDSLVPSFLRDVASQFDNSNSADQFTDILNKAQKQITAAVDELHSILKGANVDLHDTANKLGAGLSQGLVRLGENLQTGEGKVTHSREEASYQLDAKAAFSITTQDGDTVELNFSSNNQVVAFSESQNSSDAKSKSAGIYISSDSQVSVSIRGDIDEDELEAIRSVISQVDDIAESFFGGDTEKALANLQGFDIDQNELSSVAFDLTRREQIAVSSYTEIAKLAPGHDQKALNQNNQGSVNQTEELINTIEARLESLSLIISNHYAEKDDQTSFAENKEVSLNLLRSLVSIRQDSKLGDR